MTADFSQKGAAPLRVVPPHQLRPVQLPDPTPQPASADTETVESEPAAPQASGKRRRWMILGSVLVGVTAIGLIPTPYQVGGTVQLDWKEAARQSVHPPLTAVVKQVFVKTGDSVRPGQVLAIVSSRDLEREITDVRNQLAKAYQELQSAQREQVQAQANLLETAARAQVASIRSQRSLGRVSRLQQGELPPEVAALAIQQHRLEGQLQEMAVQVRRYEALYQQGAVSLEDLESRQIQSRNLERDLADNTEQMRLAQQQLIDTAEEDAATVAEQGTTVMAAEQVSAATLPLSAYQQSIQTLEQQLQDLQAQQQGLTLRASTAGTVITSDLDLLVGQELRPDAVLLQVANLNQLTANVQVTEEDLDYVQQGASVTFRPRQAKLESYNAKVEAVLYNVQTDDTKQQRVATVRVVIENPDGKLRPGSSGYARIFSEWIPLYQQVGRELLKFVPEKFL